MASELWTDEWADLKKEKDSYGGADWIEMNEPCPKSYSAWSRDTDHVPKEKSYSYSRIRDSYGHGQREEEVAILRDDVARLRYEAKFSRDKLADIKHLLRSSLQAAAALAKDRRDEETRKVDPQFKEAGVRQPDQPQDGKQ